MHTCTNRRKIIIVAGIACIGSTAQPARAAQSEMTQPQLGNNAEHELIDRATAFISRRYAHGEQVFAFPVSRLQREFRLGYRRACSLAEELQAAGCWTMRSRADGTRYARILR